MSVQTRIVKLSGKLEKNHGVWGTCLIFMLRSFSVLSVTPPQTGGPFFFLFGGNKETGDGSLPQHHNHGSAKTEDKIHQDQKMKNNMI